MDHTGYMFRYYVEQGFVSRNSEGLKSVFFPGVVCLEIWYRKSNYFPHPKYRTGIIDCLSLDFIKNLYVL